MLRSQIEKGDKSVETNVEEERKMMETWPETKEPKVFTQTPMPSPYTNPPLVIPDVGKPLPPPKKSMTMEPLQRDSMAEAGAADGMDFRPDLSEYDLVIVKDKDVPNNTGYNPRARLKFFPKGRLPGSNETFYMVTHKFADSAGVPSEKRGMIKIKSDSKGRPEHPLRSEMGGAGGTGDYRSENEEGGTMMAGNMSNMVYIMLILVAVLLIFLAVMKQHYKTDSVPFNGN